MKYAIAFKGEEGRRDKWVGKADLKNLNYTIRMQASASKKNRFFFSDRKVAHAIARGMSEAWCVYVVVKVPS